MGPRASERKKIQSPEGEKKTTQGITGRKMVKKTDGMKPEGGIGKKNSELYGAGVETKNLGKKIKRKTGKKREKSPKPEERPQNDVRFQKQGGKNIPTEKTWSRGGPEKIQKVKREKKTEKLTWVYEGSKGGEEPT